MGGSRIRIGSLIESVRVSGVVFSACVIVSVGVLGGCIQESETVPTPTPTQPWWVPSAIERQEELVKELQSEIRPGGRAAACVRGELTASQRRHQQHVRDIPSYAGVPSYASSLEYICREALECVIRLVDDNDKYYCSTRTSWDDTLDEYEIERLPPYTGRCLDTYETWIVLTVTHAYYDSKLLGGEPMSRHDAQRWEEIQQDPRIPSLVWRYYVPPAKPGDFGQCLLEPPGDTTDELAG